MKFVTFTLDRQSGRPGVLLPTGDIVDFGGDFESLQTLIESGPEALDYCRAHLETNKTLRALNCRLLAPLPIPPQMRDFMTFEKHLQQSMRATARLRAVMAGVPDVEAFLLEAESRGALKIPEVWYQRPVYYKCNRFAVSGHNQDIIWPRYSCIMDYECELACVIGRSAKNVDIENAQDYIFGYTIFNDLSARDEQMLEMQGFLGPAKGKDFDGANAIGPCIVTTDEISDPQKLAMIVRVNGEERSRGTSADMHWSFSEMIAHVSRDETLYPGEILASGTVGDGCGLESGRFLNHGDVVEIEIENIGVLRNRVLHPEASSKKR